MKRVKDLVAVESEVAIYFEEDYLGCFSCTWKELHALAVGQAISQAKVLDLETHCSVEENRIILHELPGKSRQFQKNHMIKSGLKASEVLLCMEQLHHRSPLFIETGGTHNGALMYNHKLWSTSEDISRHCMVDKLIGKSHIGGLDPKGCALLVSCRVTKSIMQKVYRARIPIIASTSAVMNTAIDMAKEHNITLAGFVRGQRLNIYYGGNIEKER